MAAATVLEDKKVTSKKPKEPGKYKVIICNDDVTPVEFVIAILMEIFKHTEPRAIELTLEVHHNGSAVAGVYSHEVAEQKCFDAVNLARTNRYPLIVKAEEE